MLLTYPVADCLKYIMIVRLIYYFSGRLWHSNHAWMLLRGPKCAMKLIPTPACTDNTNAGWIHASMLLYLLLTLPSEYWSRNQEQQHVSNFLLSSFGEPLKIIGSASDSPGVVFCIYSQSASGLEMLFCILWLHCNFWRPLVPLSYSV